MENLIVFNIPPRWEGNKRGFFIKLMLDEFGPFMFEYAERLADNPLITHYVVSGCN